MDLCKRIIAAVWMLALIGAVGAEVAVAQSAGLEDTSSISALLATVHPSSGQTLTVQGFYVADDGGGGTFRFDPASNAAHDGGMVIAPGAPDPAKGLAAYLRYKPAARGRWLRSGTPERVNVKWFGAKADGIQNDSPAIIAAAVYLYARNASGTLYLPAGTYYAADQLPLYPHVHLLGDGIGRTIVQRRDGSDYLLGGGVGGSMEMSISQITFDNPQRVLLFRNRSHIAFHDVEFLNGMVRFEQSSYIQIDRCLFRDNIGKAAYASADCQYVSITNNIIRNTAYGGLNLSGHTHSLVANNMIIKDALSQGVPGYGGIRLPNSAQFNTVSGNVVQNYPRGIFVLSGSSYNTIVANVVNSTASQGVLIESDRNVVSQNVVVNPGAEGIRLNGANGCVVSANQISTTRPSIPALSLTPPSENNQLLNNLIDGPVGVAIAPGNAERNVVSGNATVKPPIMPTTQPAAE